jgi:hypothetical protein
VSVLTFLWPFHEAAEWMRFAALSDVDLVVGRQKMSLIEIAARFGLMAKPNRRNTLGVCKEHLNAKVRRFIINTHTSVLDETV